MRHDDNGFHYRQVLQTRGRLARRDDHRSQRTVIDETYRSRIVDEEVLPLDQAPSPCHGTAAELPGLPPPNPALALTPPDAPVPSIPPDIRGRCAPDIEDGNQVPRVTFNAGN